MTKKQQKALHDYLVGALTKLKLSPPRGNSAEQVIAHFAELNGRAIAVLEFAIEELKS